eukprot:gene26493-35156_t
MALHLINKSNSDVYVSYKLSAVNQGGGSNYTWEDPEGIILFGPINSGNNEWGSDEFYPLSELTADCDFTKNNKMVFSVEIEVLGRGDLIDNASATSIEKIKVTDQLGLIELADNELVEVISKLPYGRDLAGRLQHEDAIIKFRAKK